VSRLTTPETLERPVATGAVSMPPAPGAQRAPSRDVVELLPSAVALVLLVIALASNGAFAVHSWAPLCVVALALLAVSPRRRLRPPALVAIAAIWSFAAWTALSVLWSDAQGDAIEGAARAILYAALFTVPLTTLPDRRSARHFAILMAAGLGSVVAVTFVLVVVRGDELFLAGRLDTPIGYRNGTAALFVLAFWPLLCLAAARHVAVGVRAASFAGAVAALTLAFLTQSRGSLIGFGVGAVVVVLVGPDRLRRAWLIVVAFALLLMFSGPLLGPYDAFIDKTDVGSAVDRASNAALAVVLLAAVGMLFVAIFDRGLRGSAAARGTLRTAAGALLAVGAVIGVIGALAHVGNPIDFAGDKYDEFRSLEVTSTDRTRFGSTGGQRYDLWRIATDQFSGAPVAGEGEGSYRLTYFRERKTDRNLTDPHSLPLRVMAELGLVGLLLLLAWFAAIAAGVARGRARGSARGAGTWAAAYAAIGATFFAQTTVDWLWLIPGVAGVAALALGVALALAEPEEAPAGAAPRRRLRGVAVTVACVLVALAVACFYLSDYEVREARAAGQRSPQEQLDAARRAATLNPFALSPRLLEAGALEDLGRRDEARQTLLDARDLERGFVVMGLLGDLELRAGHEGAARRWYRRALAANPADVGLQQLARGEHG
jgi:O-antigen ligase/polysaccharide polymerase Wzy-like membrane protein